MADIDSDKFFENYMKARKAIVNKIGPYKKDSPDVYGEIDCPVCKTGKLSYRRASYNGHIWGQCDTANCVKWME